MQFFAFGIKLFPAQAGVILAPAGGDIQCKPVPRASGGDP